VKGDVIYVVRHLLKTEGEEVRRRLGIPNLNTSPFQVPKSSIIIQQLTDGFLTFRHFGIDVGDGTVIHFVGDGERTISTSNSIQHTSMEKFLKGGKLKVDGLASLTYDRDEIVSRSMSKVGSNFGGYDLVDNNCEHFANWCASATRTSRQVFHKNDDRDVVEKAIDNVFDPLINVGDKIDRLFGWGNWKR
jgi:hypothetical protein